jgi:hypothetical protein
LGWTDAAPAVTLDGMTYLLVLAVGIAIGLGVGRALWTHQALRHLGAADHRARWAAIRESRAARRASRYDF